MSGFTLDAASIRILRELIAWWRGRPKSGDARPAIRYDPSAARAILVKLDSGQTLTSTPGDSATGKIQIGAPGEEEDGEPVTVYSGRMMENAAGEITGGSYVICQRINGYWQVTSAACGPSEE
jgi:hypothetical protein